jgi:hypothetical protein
LTFLIRHWVTLLVLLPASLFLGILFGTAGTALHPPLASVAAPLVCDGEMVTESQAGSARAGQNDTSRRFRCAGDGAGGIGADVTLKAVSASILIYAVLVFLLLRLVLRPLLRPWLKPRMAGLFTWPGDAPGRTAGGDARLQAGGASLAAGGGAGADAAGRLEQLQALHARGLITDAEYKAKKAEILAEL